MWFLYHPLCDLSLPLCDFFSTPVRLYSTFNEWISSPHYHCGSFQLNLIFPNLSPNLNRLTHIIIPILTSLLREAISVAYLWVWFCLLCIVGQLAICGSWCRYWPNPQLCGSKSFLIAPPVASAFNLDGGSRCNYSQTKPNQRQSSTMTASSVRNLLNGNFSDALIVGLL